jgi:hypothetical protein
MQPTDIVILSNAPGEVATWVRPVVKALAQIFTDELTSIRISVLLSPCPHSTGQEAAIASSYQGVERVLPASEFWKFLLWGKTQANWQWHQRGIVVFMGGDQFFTVAIAKRLGYSSLIYVEWDARWYRWVDRFAAMNQKAIAQVPKFYQPKFSLVGDLIADVALEVKQSQSSDLNFSEPLIGLLVGSKPAKLAQGVPLCLAIAEKIQQQLPQAKFIIPVAPTLDLTTLVSYASVHQNPLLSNLGNVTAELIDSQPGLPFLLTSGGTKIKLITEFPAYQTIANCQLCLTTVGANTAELTALRVPMIVLLPTQQLDAMRSWDGLPGILANLPGVGTIFAKLINWLVLRQGRLFAWPNIWAGTEIVPELVGKLAPERVAQLVLQYLQHPEQLQTMRDRLNAVRGETGATLKIAEIIKQEITKI